MNLPSEIRGRTVMGHAAPPLNWADPLDDPANQVTLLVLAKEPGAEWTVHDEHANSRREPDTFWVFHLNSAGDVTDDDAFFSVAQAVEYFSEVEWVLSE